MAVVRGNMKRITQHHGSIGLNLETEAPVLSFVDAVKIWRANPTQLFSEFLVHRLQLTLWDSQVLSIYQKGKRIEDVRTIMTSADIVTPENQQIRQELGIVVGSWDRQMSQRAIDLPWEHFQNHMILSYNKGISPRGIVKDILVSTGFDFS
jgi:hypothetical protein